MGRLFNDGYDKGPVRADRISVDTENFSKNLSAADDNVQKALETLDQLEGGGGTVFSATLAVSPTSPQLFGTGQWKDVGELSFTATYSNGTPSDAYVSMAGAGNSWSPNSLTLTNGFLGPTLNDQVVNYPGSIDSAIVFTNHATTGAEDATYNRSVYFYNPKYWGVLAKASGYDEADVEGLAGSELSGALAKVFTVNPGAGEYIIYAYPKRYGTATFWVGGFEGGFIAPETVSVTNANGFTEDYYVYRSTNPNLGSTTVTVA